MSFLGMRPALVLGLAWAAYAAFLAFAYPLSPFAVLAMAAPLMLTGWYAPRWAVSAAIGIGHGIVLAVVGWSIGAFAAWPGEGSLPLAMALVTLLSWSLTLAGWTARIVQTLRARTDELEAARREIDANAATVEAVYSASAAGLVGLDGGGTIVSWNPGAAAIFGHPATAAVGRSIEFLAAAGERDDCTGRIRYVAETGREMSTFSGTLRAADGQPVHVEVRPRTIIHADGRPGVLLTVVDHTRETALGAEVARQAQQQERIIHNLDEVLYSVAVPSMDVLMMGRSIERVSGHDPSELTDFRTVLELAHPEDREEVMRRWERARSGEKSVLRWRLRTAQGAHVWVEDRVVPARDEDGRVVRVDGSLRRILRELELERQAQRMMRWLDALEPLSGGGAWSVDLRSGAWQWSTGMRRLLAIEEEPEHGLAAWNARLDADSARAFAALVHDPENPHPLTVHVAAEGGQWMPVLIEPWVQRDADGEPIWLYGIARPRLSRRERRRRAAAEDAAAHAAAVEVALADTPAPPAPDVVGAGVASGAGDADLVNAEQAAPADRPTTSRVEAAVEEAWITPPAGAAVRAEPENAVEEAVERLASAAERHAVERVLAGEQQEAELRLERARQALEAAEAEARQHLEAARAGWLEDVQEARERAAAEAAKAQAAEAARLQAQEDAALAAARAEEERQAALAQVETARAAAREEVAAALRRAEQESEKAGKAAAEKAAAEQALQEALEAAEQAKRAALQDADLVRVQAMQEAEAARRLAEQEAQKARDAAAAVQAADDARRAAVAAAEEAKAQALQEAGKTRSAAVRAAEEAQRRAEAEAMKAQRAEEARRAAEAAQRQAADAAEAAKAKALREADAVRKEALQAADEAKQRAQKEAEAARQAASALRAAEAARQEALDAAEQAQRRAHEEEEVRKTAVHQAQLATQKAVQEAERALEAAQLEAQRAEAAEAARIEAEQRMQAAIAEAQAEAEAARDEAERIKAHALEEAERARAAARAEAAKAQQAEKTLAERMLEARRSRDEAVREAEQARDHAIQEAERVRDETMQLLAEAQARADEAEARAEAAWASARAQPVVQKASAKRRGAPRQAEEEVAAAGAAGAEAAEEAGGARSVPTFESASTQVPEVPPEGMDVVWDDEIGWVPRPRGGQSKDKAEQLKAKTWQGDAKPKKGAGPWALD